MIAALAMTALSVGAALEIGLAAMIRSRAGRRSSPTQAALQADGGQIPTLDAVRR